MRIVRDRDLYLLAVVALMTLAGALPFRPRRALGSALAFVAYRISHRKRRDSEQGVSLALAGAVTPRERTAIVKAAFRQFWQDAFVSPRSSRPGTDSVAGLSHVHDALAAGRGVILWESSQFGSRMTAKRILRDAGLSICQVHADNHVGGFGEGGRTASVVRQRLVEPFFDRRERRFVAEIASLSAHERVGGRRALLRLLADNRIVCMANDGRFGQKFVSVPFFGQPRRIATGIATLARVTRAAILPMFCVETRPGEWLVTIEPPLRSDAADHDDAASDLATQYVTLLESYVRRYPGQFRTWDMLRNT
jgi:lauroyl/myristoyl acyltransferase